MAAQISFQTSPKSTPCTYAVLSASPDGTQVRAWWKEVDCGSIYTFTLHNGTWYMRHSGELFQAQTNRFLKNKEERLAIQAQRAGRPEIALGDPIHFAQVS
jgi:hypothetical protein